MNYFRFYFAHKKLDKHGRRLVIEQIGNYGFFLVIIKLNMATGKAAECLVVIRLSTNEVVCCIESCSHTLQQLCHLKFIHQRK